MVVDNDPIKLRKWLYLRLPVGADTTKPSNHKHGKAASIFLIMQFAIL
jgi:hypothetical protein